MTVRILEGDAIDVLRTLPAESVQCCVTSPPYWGLRDYGIPPSIWGGDPDCSHQFGEEVTRTLRGGVGDKSMIDGDQSRSGSRLEKTRNGSFCRCGAWRGCLGLEPTPDLFVEHAVMIFREVYRVLRDDGTLWINIGDCYSSGTNSRTSFRRDRADCNVAVGRRGGRNGHEGKHPYAGEATLDGPNRCAISGVKPKNLVGIPWWLAFALRADGWYLRSEVIWHKPNPMPESVVDRPTRAHEQVFLLTKSAKYFYDIDATREPCTSDGGSAFGKVDDQDGADASLAQARRCNRSDRERYIEQGRNIRSVWTIPTFAFPEAHFATFPPRLAETCIKAGTSERGCCPRCGAPWGRVTERVDSGRKQKMPDGYATHAGGHGSFHRDGREKGKTGVPIMVSQTIGWKAGCRCIDEDATGQSLRPDISREPIPCTVLDPFGGAGTTGLVADRLGRDATLIELNPDYAEMARRRITKDAGLFAAVE